jgi:hypothetical protein
VFVFFICFSGVFTTGLFNCIIFGAFSIRIVGSFGFGAFKERLKTNNIPIQKAKDKKRNQIIFV